MRARPAFDAAHEALSKGDLAEYQKRSERLLATLLKPTASPPRQPSTCRKRQLRLAGEPWVATTETLSSGLQNESDYRSSFPRRNLR